jgi:hypothetical protein
MVNNQLFYYDVLSQLRSQIFSGCLTSANIQGGFVHWDELKAVNGSYQFNFWGYALEKNKVKYLLPTIKHNPLGEVVEEKDIKLILPLKFSPNSTTKVSYRGVVYELINSYNSLYIPPTQTMPFRQLVDTLSCFTHTNPTHWKLWWFIVLSQLFDRANFRVSTPAGFGKDSAVDTSNSLLMNCGTVENPTIAKLEERAYRLKLLVVNEVVDITKDNWRQIEQFLLATGAHKNEVTKRSRAFGGVEETINISKLSLTLMYNDIDHYSDMSVYLDSVSKHAVLDRFPPLRLYGRLKEDFNSVKNTNIVALTTLMIPEYKELVGNMYYFRDNIEKHTKTFDDSRLIDLPERWKLNIHRLLKIISAYCETQEEYDKWIEVINSAHVDYMDMVKYPQTIEKFKKRLTVEKLNQEVAFMKKIPTFTERLKYMEQPKTDKPTEDWKL